MLASSDDPPHDTRPVPGHPLHAGSDGRIWIWKRNYRKWMPLKAKDKDGRASVNYRSDSGRRIYLTVPRIVLAAWGDPRPIGHQVMHFPNEDYMDNRLDNLRWVPKNSHLVGRPLFKPCEPRRGSSHKLSRFITADIHAIRNLYREGFSATEIAELHRCAQMTILRVLRGERYKEVIDPLGPIVMRGAIAVNSAMPAKLTWDNVVEIRGGGDSRERVRLLATRFGVTPQTIRNVLRGKTFKT